MTELAVTDWDAALAWFRDVLLLQVQIRDDARKFALFGGEGGRFAIVPSNGTDVAKFPLLTFFEPNLEDARERLLSHGVIASEIVIDPREPFRSFRVFGPEGIPITIFAWTQADSFNLPPEATRTAPSE